MLDTYAYDIVLEENYITYYTCILFRLTQENPRFLLYSS